MKPVLAIPNLASLPSLYELVTSLKAVIKTEGKKDTGYKESITCPSWPPNFTLPHSSLGCFHLTSLHVLEGPRAWSLGHSSFLPTLTPSVITCRFTAWSLIDLLMTPSVLV